MNGTPAVATSEMGIFRRIVEGEEIVFSKVAAAAILGLNFSRLDRERMNELAAKNRDGKLTAPEEHEPENYIRVGQSLGILQSKARRSLKDAKGSMVKKNKPPSNRNPSIPSG